ncbi:protein phosphatase 2C domain-containing protein [Verrucomicrobium sp. BvORR034]|jgi:serine/threonine protein phosphatase PrpC|uniref:PP2C family protein-serine/threonine phosphatase n=1 Tax=Verrucomicrobium sp. BvORR034 TaxID=1396418 RepID=UPI000A9810B6|nr:protein phosphatase 2C domain-containing protein [Verrucomicrobium sp. BvORR034]
MTHRGRVRVNNEDTFLALTFDAHEVRYLGKIGESTLAESDFIFAVSDGMGGAKSGEFASRIAAEKITRLLPRSFKFSAQRLVPGFADILSLLFDNIHTELTRMGRVYDECAGMGATLSLGWFTPGWMYFGHLGDSRIYYFPKDGEMTQVTHDHSHVGWLRRTGKINEREARTHPRRNVLQQALGAGHQLLDPHVGAVSCQAGDRFLFCTDGLMDGLWDRAIKDLVMAPSPAQKELPVAQLLVETALAESGKDNITALVVEML